MSKIEWRPIATAPEMHWVLIAAFHSVDIAILDENKWVCRWEWDYEANKAKPVISPFAPTHWAPLPDPPKGA